MSSTGPSTEPATDVEHVRRLSACDEALAAGRAPPESDAPPDELALLQLLDQLRPRRPEGALPPVAPSGRGQAEPDAGPRYVLRGVHAEGGIGRVWLAYDTELGRDVALKVLRPERIGDAGLTARFLHEARITGRLQHP